ncbi:MAG: hypothetical protein AB7G17_07335 [Phycisphaerales bacterium]
MFEFVIGVISSVAASAIMLACVTLFSDRAKWFLLGLTDRFTGLGLVKFFRNDEAAEGDLAESIRTARFIKIFCSRGMFLERAQYSEALRRAGEKYESIRILLPCLSCAKEGPDWTGINEKELGKLQPEFGSGIFRKQIEHAYDLLAHYRDKPKLQVRPYNLPHLGKVIITDRVAYVTFYTSDTRASQSCVYKFAADGVLFRWAERVFDLAWENAPADRGTLAREERTNPDDQGSALAGLQPG